MNEYTSLDVSRYLKEAGFEGEPSAWWQQWPDETVGWSIGSFDTYATVHICSYRADTLMEWLAERGMITYLAKSSKGFHVAYALTGVWLWTANADAKTIPDSLGEVVLAVLAKERA